MDRHLPGSTVPDTESPRRQTNLLKPILGARIQSRERYDRIPRATESRNGRMIMRTETGGTYRVTGDRVRIVNADLDAAVELAQQHAIGEGKHGVLVTRHGPACFTVAVSAEVPYGITQERERV
jgi:hypothetical protein